MPSGPAFPLASGIGLPSGCFVGGAAHFLRRARDRSQSGTSQHLAILTRAGVLVVEPQGAARIYRRRGPRIGHILSLIEEFCSIHGLYGIPADRGEGGGSARAPGPEATADTPAGSPTG